MALLSFVESAPRASRLKVGTPTFSEIQQNPGHPPAAAAATGATTGSRLARVQAIFCILSTGCQWRPLPCEFPPYSTVHGYFYDWRDTGRHRIVKALVQQARRLLRSRTPLPCSGALRADGVMPFDG